MAQNLNEIFDTGEPPHGSTPPTGPGQARMGWKPGTPKPAQANPRFNVAGPAEKPQINYLGQSDLDTLIARIKAEEAQPPHKKNAARISALKTQALELMKRLESLWVTRTANRLLPRIDEG